MTPIMENQMERKCNIKWKVSLMQSVHAGFAVENFQVN